MSTDEEASHFCFCWPTLFTLLEKMEEFSQSKDLLANQLISSSSFQQINNLKKNNVLSHVFIMPNIEDKASSLQKCVNTCMLETLPMFHVTPIL